MTPNPDGDRGQKGIGPPLAGSQATKESCAMGQTREQSPVVVGQPPIEGPATHPLDEVEEPYGDHFAGPQGSLGMLRHALHLVVHSAEQLGDKIFCAHVVLHGMAYYTTSLGEPHGFFNLFLN